MAHAIRTTIAVVAAKDKRVLGFFPLRHLPFCVSPSTHESPACIATNETFGHDTRVFTNGFSLGVDYRVPAFIGQNDTQERLFDMLNVFFTVDVEIWCGSWTDLEARFSEAFQRYIYGPDGHFGLPYTLDVLAEHNLLGVFFVESLFATRFGLQPLAEIVGLLHERGHEVQLHLHPEWVDESRTPLLKNVNGKRRLLSSFSLAEQQILIAEGLTLLRQAGGQGVNAFRAGNFGFNTATLLALATNGIVFDSSYNARVLGLESGVMPGTLVVEPIRCGEIFEYPVTVFNDGSHLPRPLQLTACSYQEIEGLLWQALELGRKSFVIISHNFELLNQARNRPDYTVIKRFHKLCRFLDQHRDCFQVRGFRELEGLAVDQQPLPLTSPMWKTGLRICEQVMRRRYS